MAKVTSLKIMDVLPNRHYETWAMGPANTTCTYSSFDTSMASFGPYMGWLIERVEWGPRTLLAFNPSNDTTWRFELCVDEQTALLTPDDASCICHRDLHFELFTNGAFALQLPMTWTGPVLVARKKLTGLVDASTDVVTNWQSSNLLMTVWYRWVQMNESAWREMIEAKGILT